MKLVEWSAAHTQVISSMSHALQHHLTHFHSTSHSFTWLCNWHLLDGCLVNTHSGPQKDITRNCLWDPSVHAALTDITLVTRSL